MNKISLQNVNPFHLKSNNNTSSTGLEFEYRQIARLAPIEEPNLKVVTSLLFNLSNVEAEQNLTSLEKWYCTKTKEAYNLFQTLIPFERTQTGEVISLTDAQVEQFLSNIPQVTHDKTALINGAEYYIQNNAWVIEGAMYNYPFQSIVIDNKLSQEWENYSWINIINRPLTETEVEENNILATSPHYTITNSENIFLEGFRYNTYLSPEERRQQIAMLEYLDSVDILRATNVNDLFGGSGSFTPNEHAIERNILTKVYKPKWNSKHYLNNELCTVGYTVSTQNSIGVYTGNICTKLVQTNLIYNHKPLYYITLDESYVFGDIQDFSLITLVIPNGVHILGEGTPHHWGIIPSGFYAMLDPSFSGCIGECMSSAEMQYVSTPMGYAIMGNAGPQGVLYEFDTTCVFIPLIDVEQIREEYNVTPEEYILKVLRGEIEIFESIQTPDQPL